jgi:site-specific recombinase XerD/ribosomal protein L40E
MTYNHEKALKAAKKHVNDLDTLLVNKKLILSFVEFISAEGLTKVRQIKYLYTLGRISQMMNKDFSQTNKEDIVKLCSEINNSDFAEWTKHNYMVVTKRFYKWLLQSEEYPPEVKWIKTNVKNNRIKLPNELLTIEDISKLADHTNNLRDRCFILTLYESGARIGEILGVKLKDIEHDKYGVKVNLFGKTGARKIRLIACAPSISNWLMEHPDRENKNSPLFCGIWSKKRGETIDYSTFRAILKDTAKKAGINKPINPHHFRHSRATELAKIFTESQLCQYMGWIQGSKEASTYVHLSGRDMDIAVLAMHGLVEEKDKEEKFKTIICPRCNTTNSPGSKFCSSCSLGLDLETVINYEKTKDEITSDAARIFEGKDKVEALETLRQLVKILENK